MLCSDSELVSNNSGGAAAEVSFNWRKITEGKISIFFTKLCSAAQWCASLVIFWY